MPIRPPKAQKGCDLGGLLGWVAFDDFSGPAKTPQEAQLEVFGDTDDIETVEISHYQRANAEDAAKADILAALRDGDLFGEGKFSSQNSAAISSDWAKWAWRDHSASRTRIDPDFWTLRGIDWTDSSVKSNHGEFVDVIFKTEDVLRVWPPAKSPADSETAAPKHVVPASDRTVRLDHNSKGYKEATEALDAVINELNRANDVGDLTSAEKEHVKSVLISGRELFDQTQVKVASVTLALLPVLDWLGRRLTEVTVGTLAGVAALAIGKLLGIG